MTAYYNEIDAYCAAWLRNLIAAGHIAPGDVDERSIVDVAGDDLRGYSQCHFFAGIAGWSLALRLSGWSDDREVWTGSCPCQPLSSAGQRRGHADERHLWPAFQRLIAERRPATVFGEQVASKDGREWLSAVRSDLEGAGYAVGAADISAAGVGAPHIRQRLYWMAFTSLARSFVASRSDAEGQRRSTDSRPDHAGQYEGRVGRCGGAGWLGHADDEGSQGQFFGGHGSGERLAGAAGVGGGVADTGRELRRSTRPEHEQNQSRTLVHDQRCRENGDGAWSSLEWLPCADGKWRPTQSGVQPLAHGIPARVAKLRAIGNAIVPQAASAFIGAYLDCRP